MSRCERGEIKEVEEGQEVKEKACAAQGVESLNTVGKQQSCSRAQHVRAAHHAVWERQRLVHSALFRRAS